MIRRSLLTLLLVAGSVPAADQRTSTVGMPARIDQLVLPGPELEAKPAEDRRAPVVLRVVSVFPHGTAFRYDLEYYGLDAGTFDLKDYLRRKDGSPTGDLPAVPVTITLCHRLTYPSVDEEREVLRRNMALGVRREDRGAIARTEFDVLENEPVGSTEQLVTAMEALQHVHVSETFLEHVVEVVKRTRHYPSIELGASPRAGIALIKASRARALIHGRDYVIPDDLFALADDVLLHRTRLTYEALADGKTGAGVLRELLHEIGAN